MWGKDVRGVKVMPMEQLESFIRENDIDIAVLTIPKTSAVEVADKLVANRDPRYLELCACGSERSGGNTGGECTSVRQFNETFV